MEDLSNELIYEIFDYLHGCEIFNAFANLNLRFKRLVVDSMLPLKMSRCNFKHDCLQIIIPNKSRIISLDISNGRQFSKSYSIDVSFHRLESLILRGMTSNDIISLLPNLSFLPRLFSLNIHFNGGLYDSNEIYRLIFRLSKLKYNKLSTNTIIVQNTLSITTNEQFSSIEQLAIDHSCSLHTLINILSYTPKVRRLTCKNIGPWYTDISLRMFNLTHCSIQSCDLSFDGFEIFIKGICSQLRVLRFNPLRDILYLDADRWERLILQYMPYLHTFYFTYHDIVLSHLVVHPYHSFINRFTSPFWIEKRWVFHIETDFNRWPPTENIFSIQPNRMQWYELLSYQDNDTHFNKVANSTLVEREHMDVFSKEICQLTIRGCHNVQYNQWFIDYIRFISSLTKITSLNIEFDSFSIDILVQCLHHLPYLDLLTIVFMNSNQIIELTKEQMNIIHEVSHTNIITKINIEQIVELNQVDILMNLCPRMEYLQIKCRNYMELEILSRFILMKRKANLYSLCFWISEADETMVNRLQTMINCGKLLVNYTIQRLHDRIYLQWQ